MSDDSTPPDIKITDRRHFDRTGERRPDTEAPKEADPASPSPTEGSAPRDSAAPQEPSSAPRPTPAGAGRGSSRPTADASGPSSRSGPGAAGPGQERVSAGRESERPGPAPEDLSSLAAGLSSSFSLLVARLAQETEIYLGLVPYPGKETPEPDLEAARAMIDVLSMLQEKTRGNLDPEESRLLIDLLYNYRLEFVRRRSGGEAR